MYAPQFLWMNFRRSRIYNSTPTIVSRNYEKEKLTRRVSFKRYDEPAEQDV